LEQAWQTIVRPTQSDLNSNHTLLSSGTGELINAVEKIVEKEPLAFFDLLLSINLYLDAHCNLPDFSSQCTTNPGKNPAVISAHSTLKLKGIEWDRVNLFGIFQYLHVNFSASYDGRYSH
jgi:hypothetical protein